MSWLARSREGWSCTRSRRRRGRQGLGFRFLLGFRAFSWFVSFGVWGLIGFRVRVECERWEMQGFENYQVDPLVVEDRREGAIILLL